MSACCLINIFKIHTFLLVGLEKQDLFVVHSETLGQSIWSQTVETKVNQYKYQVQRAPKSESS